MIRLLSVVIGLFAAWGTAAGGGEAATASGQKIIVVSPPEDYVPPPKRWYGGGDAVDKGAVLYQEHCAQCHGAQAQGAEEWKRQGPDGRFPPPPLNGTGHAWHHPLPQLRHVIRNGGPKGRSNMPAWGGKLGDEEIDSTIAWFQSLWPDEVYRAWAEIGSRSR